MIFTEEQLRQCSGWFAELEAKSIGSFPSEFGVNTGNNELNRVFRLEVSDAIDFGVAFLKKYHTASAIPDTFDPADLPLNRWTVTDPMMDGETHEGEYRHTKLRVFRQTDSGKEYFYIVQTLAKGFEDSATREYEYEVDNEACAIPDVSGLKFYDSGVEFGGLPVFYGKGDVYALWAHSTLGDVVTVVQDVGQTPEDYFLESGGTYTGVGTWTGCFTLSPISETVADLSMFRLASGDYYHENHSQLILRLENVAPGAAHDLCEYLNQDTFLDVEYFDDTLDGTWYRTRVRPEVQDDGSHHVFLFLTDTGNTNSYVRYKAGPHTWKGMYHKWDATEETIAELERTIRFEDDGQIDEDLTSDTSRTLQALVVGRSVSWSRINRNPTSRLFELVVEIVWETEINKNTAATPHGKYNQSTWVVQHFGAEDWPVAADLAPIFDDGADASSSDILGVASTIGVKYYYTPTKTYYVCHSGDGSTQDLTETAYFEEYDVGLSRTDRTLGGPSLGGLPRLNNADNGTYDYAIVSVKTMVVDGGWHILGSPAFKTNRSTIKPFSGVQPIRLRLGGQKAYEVDSRGNLIGVDWNLEWDDSSNDNDGIYPDSEAPNNWVTHGYQARYGDWQSYWTKGFGVGVGSLWAPSHDGATCRGVFSDDTIYTLGDVSHFDGGSGDAPRLSGADATAESFYELSGAPPWTHGTTRAVGDVVQSGDKVYTCLQILTGSEDAYAPGTALAEPNWREGVQGNGVLNHAIWVAIDNDLVVSKIAIEGVGSKPFERPDLHIEIKQELQEEVEWILGWEWNATTHYTAAQTIVFLVDGKRYQAKAGADVPPAGTVPTTSANWDEVTTNPTGWDADSLARHGDWRASWTKGYAHGPASLRTGMDDICKGPYSSSALYQIGDVVAKGTARETPQFEVVSGAPAWAYGTTHAVGDVVQSGDKVYTCLQILTGSEDAYAPGTVLAEPNWSAGAEDGSTPALTWAPFSADSVVSKIATFGVGVEPFEAFVTVGVLNEDGTNAYSTSARYSFFSNYALNPKVQEESRCVMQRQQTLELITYFAVNPHFLTDFGGRMPVSWANLDAIQSNAEDSTDGVLTIPYNENNSNFNLEHRIERIDAGMDVWAIRKIIVLNSEVEDDTTAAQEILNRLPGASTGSRSGGTVVVKHDRTGMGGDAWDGPYLDLS